MRNPLRPCVRCSNSRVLYHGLCRQCFKTHPLNFRTPKQSALNLLRSWLDRDNAVQPAPSGYIDHTGTIQPGPAPQRQTA